MYKVQRGMKFVKDKSDLSVNVRKKKKLALYFHKVYMGLNKSGPCIYHGWTYLLVCIPRERPLAWEMHKTASESK